MAKSARPTWLAALSPYARKKPAAEPCELCSAALGPEHQHLIEPATRHLLCACDACAILFVDREARRYRRVPRDAQFLRDFRLTDDQWNDLRIPINMAFFYRSSVAERVVAMYPSPAGATESLLELESWDTLAEENPILHDLEPDVEALLVTGTGSARECYRAPIDECFKLVGLIRTHWRGLSGGALVWEEIARFFAELRERAGVPRERTHA